MKISVSRLWSTVARRNAFFMKKKPLQIVCIIIPLFQKKYLTLKTHYQINSIIVVKHGGGSIMWEETLCALLDPQLNISPSAVALVEQSLKAAVDDCVNVQALTRDL